MVNFKERKERVDLATLIIIKKKRIVLLKKTGKTGVAGWEMAESGRLSSMHVI